MKKYLNDLYFNSKTVQIDEVLRIVDSCKPQDPFDFLRVLQVWDDGLLFITKSLSTGEAVATCASLKCRNTEIELSVEGSAADPIYIHGIYYNGHLTMQQICYPCTFSIQVPACLGYDGNMYESDFCTPEDLFTAQDDPTSIAVAILEAAIKEAPNEEGAKMLSNNSELFDTTLKAAEVSLARIYDSDLFPAYDSSDNCSFDSCISNVATSDTDDVEDSSDFPF